MALPSIALPGTLLGSATKYLPGPGTHINESQIYASIAGSVSTSASASAPPASSSATATPTPKPSSAKQKPLPLLSITRPTAPINNSSSVTPGAPLLPTVDATILVRITRLTARTAHGDILAISSTVCSAPFQALIRREDIRATEKDKVTVADSFRVGDLVRGVVISLGDQGGYYVSTARNELGVVMAESEDGNQMVPVSWKEFVDVKTGKKEGRKVAKPF